MVEIKNSGTANNLYECLKLCLAEKNISANLIGFASDTTSVMAGSKHSIFTLLKEDFPNIVTVKCSCHMIHLVASKACQKLPESLESLLKKLSSHFHKSSIRQDRLREFQEYFSVQSHRILSPSNTRWLALKECVDRALEQYTPLNEHLRESVFSEPTVAVNEMLEIMEDEFTKIYLEFMSYILEILVDFNKLFQSENSLLHILKSETEKMYVKSNDVFTLNHENVEEFVPLEKIYFGVSAFATLNISIL
ncbi:Protein of unknown function [Cotesia congregata]|uniref:Uncharacterized protein n=1 Tax=Cotesia congregata TaxID=51543 RepID=A0A8J2E6W5_COTCN|nr:Protein of unknown function [Cotesia congregata]